MGWIGVDLDGTLSVTDGSIGDIGAPVPRMVARVRAWLDEHREVRIVTARLASSSGPAAIAVQKRFIEDWCLQHLGTVLKVTAEKDYQMEVLWDDRAVQVETNTGERVVDQLEP